MRINDKIKAIAAENDARSTGRTTRMVDMYIQRMFDNPGTWIKTWDHQSDGDAPSQQRNRYVFDIIMKRMNSEHYHLFASNLFEHRPHTCEIRLVMNEKEFNEVRKRMES